MKKNFSTLINKNTITSIAIGGFDGMHYAHEKLFELLDENGAIISIESGYANLTPKSFRQEYTKYPIYYYLLDEIKHLDGTKFISLLKEEYPNLKTIVVGFDFYFGKDRKYSASNLKELFDGKVKVLDEVKVNGIGVHSRVIRKYIKEGDILFANKLLNKEYKIYGKQIKGQGLGSKEFVPTINLHVDEFLLPNEGVYLTRTIINDKEYNSLTFLGHRKTTDNSFAVETHILDENIVNTKSFVSIKFLNKIRDNKKYSSFDSLKKQIFSDIEHARLSFNLL